MSYMDMPLDMAVNEYLRSEEEAYEKLPTCDRCGEKITGDYEYHLDGERMCEDCADEWLQDQRTRVEVDE